MTGVVATSVQVLECVPRSGRVGTCLPGRAYYLTVPKSFATHTCLPPPPHTCAPTQYEEALFRCEDDRYEFDMTIERCASVMRTLRHLMDQIQVGAGAGVGGARCCIPALMHQIQMG